MAAERSFPEAVTSSEAQPMYARDLLLSARELLRMQDASPSIGLATRHVTLPGSPKPQPRIIPPPCSPPGASSPREAGSVPFLPRSAAVLGLAPPGLTLAEEPLSPELEEEIEAAAASAWRAMTAAEAAVGTPEALRQAATSSWGRDGDFSQLLTRLRRASGGCVSLALLRQEAPPELRSVMKDGAAFATWLRHRTGAVEVCGAVGREIVVLSKLQKNRSSLEAAESCLPAGSFCFDPAAMEFYPTDNDSSAETQSDKPEVLDDDCLLPAAVAEAVLSSSESMTVDEAHDLLFRTRLAGDAAFRMPPGLGPEEEEGDMSVWPTGTEQMPFWQHSDEGPVWSFDDLTWQNNEAPIVPQADDDDDDDQSSATVKLNAKAAVFRPTISLAEYGQAKMLGSARRRAARARERYKASGVPDAIPEETVTCSEETTSDTLHRATGSETTTSNDEEESVPTVAAVDA
eukprot:TRINITY_DN59658_c0_g1_i1.p1 TRINITY_DN59658_c0_g1~~TRINITY_DN59658_c0_g1_i1.p1  ORF type:complete len:489 (-),score=90.83 TRINITY_DN59658_c0_g1_i1:312-1691(-)